MFNLFKKGKKEEYVGVKDKCPSCELQLFQIEGKKSRFQCLNPKCKLYTNELTAIVGKKSEKEIVNVPIDMEKFQELIGVSSKIQNCMIEEHCKTCKPCRELRKEWDKRMGRDV